MFLKTAPIGYTSIDYYSGRYSVGQNNSPIGFLFEPRNVAVVGASRTPGKIGNVILSNLKKLGYKGSIYPVNPGMQEVLDMPVYPSVDAIPGDVELAVIALPAHLVLDVVRDCARKRVGGLVIISSGFSDVGGEGVWRQQELLEIARSAGMRVIGPNTTGLLNPYAPFTTTFDTIKGEVRAGSIAFISQTGMFAGLMLQHIITAERFGLSKVAGLGNKADVADHEVLDYLEHDEATKAIMLYVEGVKDGRKFLEAARRVSRTKPIAVLKVGSTEAGARAALSHTGSITGDDRVFDAVCRQAGMVRAGNFNELVDFAKMFAYQPVSQGSRIAIVTISMGAGALAADMCYQGGLEIPELNPATIRRIKENSPGWAVVRNPVDTEPIAEKMGQPEGYRIALEAVLADGNVDMCLVVIGTMLTDEHDISFMERLKKEHPEKPLAVYVIGDDNIYRRHFQVLEGYGIPVFSALDRAINGLLALHRYRRLNADRK
jgi:acyl-CoA synthetase (NDP forming)